MTKATILAVDDSPEILDFIKTILSDKYTIKLATRGEVALGVAEAQQPDIILLDVMMPGIGGIETCKALKNNPKTTHIPIIMISGMTCGEDEILVLQAGAADYISKPISASILQSRIARQLLLITAQKALEKSLNKIAQERKHVEQIVQHMRQDKDFDHRYISHATRSEEINSGDLVLSAFRPDGCQHLMVGDFTGHGLPAAIGGPLVTYIFYSRTHEGKSMSKIIVEMNNLLKKVLPINVFMAATAAEINEQRNHALLWNAGMEDILLLKASEEWASLPSKNLALGIVNSNEMPHDYKIEITANDFIYFLTDGVTEISDSNSGQEMFGFGRLKSLLLNNKKQSGCMEKVLDEVTEYAGFQKEFDDMTVLEISFS